MFQDPKEFTREELMAALDAGGAAVFFHPDGNIGIIFPKRDMTQRTILVGADSPSMRAVISSVIHTHPFFSEWRAVVERMNTMEKELGVSRCSNDKDPFYGGPEKAS